MKTCTVGGCTKRHLARGFCDTHYKRWQKHGDPLTVLRPGGWLGDNATYGAVHERLWTQRGKAYTHVCPCGEQAAQWAYNHQCPNEKQGEHPYSTDLDMYVALCASCHVVLDR